MIKIISNYDFYHKNNNIFMTIDDFLCRLPMLNLDSSTLGISNNPIIN